MVNINNFLNLSFTLRANLSKGCYNILARASSVGIFHNVSTFGIIAWIIRNSKQLILTEKKHLVPSFPGDCY